MARATRVGIVGYRGYSGAELVRILDRHPSVEPALLEHRHDTGNRPEPIGAQQHERLPSTPEAVREAGLVLVFLATPPEVSMDVAPAMLDAGTRVVDLSGAFRFRDAATYKHWYKEDHTAPDLLKEAVYGLPEFCRSRLAGARFVSNPGCYPTAANLALKPLHPRLRRQNGVNTLNGAPDSVTTSHGSRNSWPLKLSTATPSRRSAALIRLSVSISAPP